MKRLILLRPEPGMTASASRAHALGLEVVRHPLFTIEAVTASVPDEPFDAIILTSANAVRFGAPMMNRFRHLPAYAVGEATADAMRAIGVEPFAVGSGGVDGLDLPAGRLLHLCGEVHRPLPGTAIAVPVYRTLPTTTPLPDIAGAVIAVHSPAAGRALDMLARGPRSNAVIAAISTSAAEACGRDWEGVHIAGTIDDAALLALAATLCQSGAR